MQLVVPQDFIVSHITPAEPIDCLALGMLTLEVSDGKISDSEPYLGCLDELMGEDDFLPVMEVFVNYEDLGGLAKFTEAAIRSIQIWLAGRTDTDSYMTLAKLLLRKGEISNCLITFDVLCEGVFKYGTFPS